MVTKRNKTRAWWQRPTLSKEESFQKTRASFKVTQRLTRTCSKAVSGKIVDAFPIWRRAYEPTRFSDGNVFIAWPAIFSYTLSWKASIVYWGIKQWFCKAGGKTALSAHLIFWCLQSCRNHAHHFWHFWQNWKAIKDNTSHNWPSSILIVFAHNLQNNRPLNLTKNVR